MSGAGISKAASASHLSERLKSLARIASLVNAGTDLQETLERITLAVCQRTRWTSSALMALDERQGLSLLVARHDPAFPGRPPAAEAWDLATSPTRDVLASGRPMVIPSAQRADQYPAYQAEALQRDYQTVVLLPLSAQDAEGRSMVMSVHAPRRVTVDAEELAFLETVTHLASLAVDRALRLLLERRQSERLGRAIALQAEAMQEVLAGGDLAQLAARAARELRRPVLLLDLTANRMWGEGRPAGVAPRDWSRLLATEPPRALVERLRAAAPGPMAGTVPLPRALFRLEGEPLQVALAPCIVAGACLGGLLIFATGQEPEPFELLLADQLRAALAVSLMRAQATGDARAESLEDLFSRLFAGTWGDREETLARAGRLGLSLREPMRLALLAPSGTKLLDEALRVAQRRLGRLPGGAAFRDGATLALLLPESDKGESALLPALRALLEEVDWATGGPATLALGQACARLEDYRRVRQDCTQMLALAAHGKRQGLLRVEDFGPVARFLATLDGAALGELLAGTLGRIEAHDARHGRQLVETLAVFLEEQGRFQAAADRLGLHVTTLRYRLRRVGELFDLDLASADTRLALALALRARSLLGSAK